MREYSIWSFLPPPPERGWIDERRTLRAQHQGRDPRTARGQAALAEEAWDADGERSGLFLAGLDSLTTVFRGRERPRGSYQSVPPCIGGVSGVVRGALDHGYARVIADGRPVAARLELTLDGGASVTLRVSWCRAFEVVADDGRKVRVDSGLLDLDAPSDRWIEVGRREVDRYLTAILPEYPRLAGRPRLDPFPYQTAYLVAVRANDRVRIGEPLVASAPRDGEAAFRSWAPPVLRPAETPSVRLERR